jgi:hypothetical protein
MSRKAISDLRFRDETPIHSESWISPEKLLCFEAYFLLYSNVQARCFGRSAFSFSRGATRAGRSLRVGLASECPANPSCRCRCHCQTRRTTTLDRVVISFIIDVTTRPKKSPFFTPPTLQDGTSRLSLSTPPENRHEGNNRRGQEELMELRFLSYRVLPGIRATSARHQVPDGLSTERRESSSWVVNPP